MKDKYRLSKNENIKLVNNNLVKLIYNSTKLEGLDVSITDAKEILDGVNSSINLDFVTCILNLRDAWREILENLYTEVNPQYICHINSFVSRNESLKWGVLRDSQVGISGTSYIPKIPIKEEVIKELEEINSIECNTEKAIKLMLYCMRAQLFFDGNKRTSMIVANKIMIENGCGIITVKEEDILEFNKLLSEYYTTGDSLKIEKFIYENCIFGIEN